MTGIIYLKTHPNIFFIFFSDCINEILGFTVTANKHIQENIMKNIMQ